MSESDKIPPQIIQEAFDLLQKRGIVEIAEPLSSAPLGWVFTCNVDVPIPNPENLPSKIPLKGLITHQFPYTPVEFFTVGKEFEGFPHQQNTKICLREERLAPRTSERLVVYTEWAKEWINDAANQLLFEPGDPYELPEFNSISDYNMIFIESSDSYRMWQLNKELWGTVECYPIRATSKTNIIYAKSYFNSRGERVYESNINESLIPAKNKIYGKWIIIPQIIIKRYSPPHIYKELNDLCKRYAIELYLVLKKAWEQNNNINWGFLLVGFPIPSKYLKEPTEMHWQSLIFPNQESQRPRMKWDSLISTGDFAPKKYLQWCKSTNIAYNRIYARGAYKPPISTSTISLFGCGALGCIVAELLSRGGVNYLNLFDGDDIEYGNFCRHTLDARDTGVNKAKALAEKLACTNPLSRIIGYPFNIPLHTPDGSHQETKEAIEAIDRSNLLIDCTTSESTFEWLNGLAVKSVKRFVLIYFDYYAKYLTIIISGNNISCKDIYYDIASLVNQEKLPISKSEYIVNPPTDEFVMEGTGCWHPTFPALNAHIYLLGASAVDIIKAHFVNEQQNGLAVIEKRQEYDNLNKVQTGPHLQILWTKIYH